MTRHPRDGAADLDDVAFDSRVFAHIGPFRAETGILCFFARMHVNATIQVHRFHGHRAFKAV